MSLKSFAAKGFSIAMNGRCNRHSKKASSYANKASYLFKSCKSVKDTNQKIDKKSIHKFIDSLKVEKSVKSELKNITPENFTGIN